MCTVGSTACGTKKRTLTFSGGRIDTIGRPGLHHLANAEVDLLDRPGDGCSPPAGGRAAFAEFSLASAVRSVASASSNAFCEPTARFSSSCARSR